MPSKRQRMCTSTPRRTNKDLTVSPSVSLSGVPMKAQRSGLHGERRDSATDELWLFAGARDVQLVPTTSEGAVFSPAHQTKCLPCVRGGAEQSEAEGLLPG